MWILFHILCSLLPSIFLSNTNNNLGSLKWQHNIWLMFKDLHCYVSFLGLIYWNVWYQKIFRGFRKIKKHIPHDFNALIQKGVFQNLFKNLFNEVFIARFGAYTFGNKEYGLLIFIFCERVFYSLLFSVLWYCYFNFKDITLNLIVKVPYIE